MLENLEELIKKRKKEALEKGIAAKARLIAMYLGKASSCGDDPLNNPIAEEGTYNDGYFSITYSRGQAGGDIMRIEVHDKVVYVEHYISGDYKLLKCEKAGIMYDRIVYLYHHGLDSYIPGIWEKKLDNLVPKAERAREKRLKEREEYEQKVIDERKKAEAAKWDLD